jgi:hypothetical protein
LQEQTLALESKSSPEVFIPNPGVAGILDMVRRTLLRNI